MMGPILFYAPYDVLTQLNSIKKNPFLSKRAPLWGCIFCCLTVRDPGNMSTDKALRTRSRKVKQQHLHNGHKKSTSPIGWHLEVAIQIEIYSVYSCIGAFLIKYIIGIRVNINSMLKAITNHSCKFDGHGQMSCIITLESHIRVKNA